MSESNYYFKLASGTKEITAYFALRRLIFAQEQGLFEADDRDEIDHIAHPIVALTKDTELVVGVVRIYSIKPQIWYGGRLGTHPDYRRGWQVGKGLINKAVTTANTWGCQRFLATVQSQNVRFFERLHWQSLEEMTIRDRLHHLMEADLNFYPRVKSEVENSQQILLKSQVLTTTHF